MHVRKVIVYLRPLTALIVLHALVVQCFALMVHVPPQVLDAHRFMTAQRALHFVVRMLLVYLAKQTVLLRRAVLQALSCAGMMYAHLPWRLVIRLRHVLPALCAVRLEIVR